MSRPNTLSQRFAGRRGLKFAAATLLLIGGEQFLSNAGLRDPASSLMLVTPARADDAAQDASPDLQPLLDKLAAMHAVTVDGKEVDAAALGKELKGKVPLLLFGFPKCEMVCLPSNKKEAVIEQCFVDKKMEGALESIHVDVFPETDGKDEKSRKELVQDVIDAGSAHHKIIAIFPKTEEDAKSLQVDFMNLIVGGAHSGQITLYGPDGKWQSRIDGVHSTDKDIRDWVAAHVDFTKLQPDAPATRPAAPATRPAAAARAR